MPTSIRWARTTPRKLRANTLIFGPGSSGWCAARSVSPRRTTCTIWSLGCSSIAMNLGEPYETGSTPLQHLLGMQSDYRGDRIDLPTKKPRKSKKNPNPQLSDEQKATNKALSQVRIFIAHTIGGMKRDNILVHVFRNRKADFEDDAVGICAGLWNFALSY